MDVPSTMKNANANTFYQLKLKGTKKISNNETFDPSVRLKGYLDVTW